MDASKAKKPNFVVTKYRKKEVEKRLPISRGLTGNARTHVPPAIRASGRAFPRVKSASKLQVPKEKSSTSKEVNFNVPTPGPSPISSPKPVKKHKPGRQIYIRACKKFLLTPIKSIRDGLKKEQLVCKYTTLREKDVEAVVLALVDNYFVRKVLFINNNLCREGAALLAETLLHTDFISHVKITDNKLGSEGARLVCSAVAHNPTITALDLSGNGFTENDGKYFKALLEISDYLTELNLSHNSFMEKGAVMISKGLAKNRHLQLLDLSWNHIRMKGAEAIGNALKHNRSLERLNLAWNGLHWQGARSMAEGLRINNTLQDLDIQCNRMSEECLAEVLKGLKNNTTLEILRLGQNHLTSAGAYKVLDHFRTLESSGIKILDFGNQPVHDQFETLLGEILQERDIQVIYGMVWHEDRKNISADDVVSEDAAFLLNSNPLTVIMECMRLQNFRLVDMFQSLDSDNNNKITVHELVNGLLKVNVPLRRDILLQFLKKIDLDGNGELDYREMKEAQRVHKRQIKALKETNDNIEETEIGRISKHIRNLMRKRYIKNFAPVTEFSSRETTPTPSFYTASREQSPSALSQSEMTSHASSSRLSKYDLTPRTISRVSSAGKVLGNISPLSLDSRYMNRSSMTSALSSNSEYTSHELFLPSVNRSTPLPPIKLN